jgi:hypothetical protein
MKDDEENHIKAKPCPCCGYLTMGPESPGSFEICEVCNWQDDPVQYQDPDYEGGANEMSLKQARRNYAEFGASSMTRLEWTRPPRQDEIPE